MAYFPAAYKKVFLGRGFQLTTPLSDYGGGDYGFFDAKTWTPIDVAGATMAAHPKVVLVLGNPDHTTDKIGPNGGYAETIKSQVIDARYIDRFWKVSPRPPQQQQVKIGWDGADDTTSPVFKCGETYWLRIDIKGSAALRFLGHNLYRRFSVSTGCCTNPGNPENVDPVEVMVEFARQINSDPLFSPFVQAVAVNGDGVVDPNTYVPLTSSSDISAAVTALQLTITYTDTIFSDCSFDPADHFENEPVIITSAQFVNEDGALCPEFQQVAFTEMQPAITAQGTGNQVLRDYILSQSYRQDYYPPRDVRLRQALDMHLVAGHVLRDPNFGYMTYFILHRVPRRSNPTGVYDQDQYLIQISSPQDIMTNFFEDWMQSYLASAGTGVVMEDLS